MNKPSLLPKALGGHLLDLWRIANFTFRNPHSYSKFRAINRARQLTGAKTFIEVGTFRGLTARRCARVFQSVKTIELDPVLHSEAAEFLKSFQNVETIRGDGLIELEKLLERPAVDFVIVFLDGHFSGGDTASGELVEPAVEELSVLSRFKSKIAGIIVDDFREFGTQKGWPMKWEIMKSAEELFGSSEYDISVHLDQIVITRLG